MNRTIKLSEEDRKELVKLYERAQTTPVIKMSMSSPSWATQAWDDVRRKMDVLGKKYGFDPKKMKGIKKKTGEIVL